jgi:methionyl-tRNA formyltransferase
LFDRSDLGGVRSFLERERPDLILCCGFPKLIPNQILAAGRHAINIHPGLLPQRPGGTPVRWAVRLGDPEYGVTAHYMTDRFDAGDLVFRTTLPLPSGLTSGEAEMALEPCITQITTAIVNGIERDGTLQRKPQTATPSMPSLRGRRQFVDWQVDDAASISRLCNAMRPRSGALTRLGAETIVLWDVEPGDMQAKRNAPGTVFALVPQGPTIATLDGTVIVRKVLNGGRVRGAETLKLRVGDRLL